MLNLAAGWLGPLLLAQTTVLYSNDFESPNMPPVVNCGNSLDISGINILYGTPGFTYAQVNTVETVVVDDPGGLYLDPSGIGGQYSLGMLSSYQDDLLAFTLDAGGQSFLNVGLHLSAIDVFGCGGPFGVVAPLLQLSLYDTPTGSFSFAAPGTLLSQATVTSTQPASSTVFAWTYGTAGLDASGATVGPVTLVFDFLAGGYSAFDNLSIVASSTTGIVDRDTDGIADDSDNCPDDPNDDQADEDRDTVGDLCDPAPSDPAVCGDRDGDRLDDCAPSDAGVFPDATFPDADPPDADPTDGGLVEDAQSPLDAGGDASMDASVDVGFSDATASDTGLWDTGQLADTGTVDGGVEPPAADDGCDCSTTGGSAVTPALLFLGLLWLPRRHRRGPPTNSNA
ncbi:MAG: hypothetical protein IPG45_27210 [Deltaproteobacteria bacterium]|nr:hypothetical protein [Deltaproteobacteria bacterium]